MHAHEGARVSLRLLIELDDVDLLRALLGRGACRELRRDLRSRAQLRLLRLDLLVPEEREEDVVPVRPPWSAPSGRGRADSRVARARRAHDLHDIDVEQALLAGDELEVDRVCGDPVPAPPPSTRARFRKGKGPRASGRSRARARTPTTP